MGAEFRRLAGIAFVALGLTGFCAAMAVVSARSDAERFDRCRDAGRKAGRIGQPPEACPHSGGWGTDKSREMWLDGWAQGDAERRTNTEGK